MIEAQQANPLFRPVQRKPPGYVPPPPRGGSSGEPPEHGHVQAAQAAQADADGLEGGCHTSAAPTAAAQQQASVQADEGEAAEEEAAAAETPAQQPEAPSWERRRALWLMHAQKAVLWPDALCTALQGSCDGDRGSNGSLCALGRSSSAGSMNELPPAVLTAGVTV